MKILFLDPARNCEGCSSGGSIQGNIGLEYVAGVAAANGYEVELLEPPLNEITYDEILNKIKNFDVVAMSCMTWNAKMAIDLAQKIKQIQPSIKLVVGGIGPTGLPEYFTPYFDAVFVGEGDQVFIEWLKGDRKEKIIYAERDLKWSGNITPLRHNEIIQNSRMRGIWPIPYKEQRVTNIIYGKGCFNNCSFCCSPLIWKQKIVWREPSVVVKELLFLAELGINSVDFLDPTFNASTEKTIELCKHLIDANIAAKIKWTAMIDPSKPNAKDIIPLMAKAGCIKIGLGIEDPTSAMRKKFLKSSNNIEMCSQTAELASANGMIVRAYLIIGAPEQTRANIKAIENVLLTWPIDEPRISIFCPFPGTKTWFEYQDKIIERDFSKWDTNHQVIKCNFSNAELLEIRTNLLKLFYGSENYKNRRANKIKMDSSFAIGYSQFEESFLKPKGYIK